MVFLVTAIGTCTAGTEMYYRYLSVRSRLIRHDTNPSFWCTSCGQFFPNLLKAFKHLKEKENIDVNDTNIGAHIGSDTFTPAEIQCRWEEYWKI